MINKPIVSVCIQTYQHAEFIEECLNSVLMQQTNFLYEIILGEDESNDGTREICKAYAVKYPDKISLFLRNREDVIHINEKPSGRFNLIENLKSCQGKYIALCEGDDYWTDPLKLQKQVDLLEQNPNLIACHHWQKNAVKKNGIYEELASPKMGHGYYPQQISQIVEVFSNKMRVKTRTVMYRNIIDEHFIPKWFYKVAFGDVPLSFIFGKIGDFGFIDEEMAVYRQTDSGVSKAGLKEEGRKAFNVQHFKNWIDIWDNADKHYNYEYHQEATKTITEFYEKLVSNLPISFASLYKIIVYNIFKRKLSFFKTFVHTKLLMSYFGRRILVKIKRKILFK